jgi:hypothetical protein
MDSQVRSAVQRLPESSHGTRSAEPGPPHRAAWNSRIASLAWTVYTGLRQKTPNPPHDVVSRAVRVELRTRGDRAAASQDHITDVVVTEIIRAAGNQS